MKKLFILFLLLTPFLVKGQNTIDADFCIHRTNKAPFTAVSNTTYRADSINCNGGTTPGIIIPDNAHDIHITKCWVGNVKNSAIQIGHNCANITIDTCFITNAIRGVNVGGGSTISTNNNEHINYNRFYLISDIVGHPTGGGCAIQLNTVNGTGIQNNNNDCYYPGLGPDVGDIISLFKVNGTSSSPAQVDNNCFVGGSSDPTGKCAIGFGDNGGSYQEAIGNKIKNSGFAGIQVAGGTNMNVQNNMIFSIQNVISGGGMTVGNYGGSGPMSNITMANNKLNWTNAQGKIFNTNIVNGATPTGWSTNTPQTVADPSVNNSILPDVLFTQCTTPVVSAPVIGYLGSPYNYISGTTIGTLTPTNTGGAAVSWSISPALPTGLNFNNSNGVISGTPTVVSPTAMYTISATNTGGTGVSKISITVKPTPISIPVIAYSPNTNIYITGNTIGTKSPISTGGAVVSYTIDKTLPAGLSFNTINGQISGNPSVISPATVYTVSGVNASGTGKTTITITVNANPIQPPNISYPTTVFNTTYGYVIAPVVPTNTGSAAAYSVSPGLPFGWNLDPATGTITALPASVHNSSSFTITATNTAGIAQTTITISVVAAPLVISAISATKYVNTANPQLQVAYSGFLGNDTPATALTTLPNVSTTASLNSPIGSYPISVSGAQANNYVISYAGGILAVIAPNTTTITFHVISGVINP